jgi:2-iminoacetate synthase
MKKSFHDIYRHYSDIDASLIYEHIDRQQVMKAIASDELSLKGLLVLLSPEGEKFIEALAHRAHELTLLNFGKVIHLYTPMYLSNYCDNECAYCGFKRDNAIERRTLGVDEVRAEADFIARKGFENILILTGGSRKKAPLKYIKDCVKAIRGKFSSVSIEVYELTKDEYKELIDEGVDGLTVYQEVYDEEIYGKVHISGPKRDYMFRMDAPERALSAGMRTVSIGALLGLGDWRKEAFFTALHARYLQDKFPASEISVSVPRIRPQVSCFKPACRVSDKNLVQIITALRIFLPRVGINLSTREGAFLRNHLLPLGITRMSAGSTTKVGGHTVCDAGFASEQFEIFDTRELEEIKEMLSDRGYQPVLKDWVNFWDSIGSTLECGGVKAEPGRIKI